MRSALVVLVVSIVTAGCAQKEPRVADTTTGVSSICPVHHSQMEKREVAVTLGAPGPTLEVAAMSKLAGSF